MTQFTNNTTPISSVNVINTKYSTSSVPNWQIGNIVINPAHQYALTNPIQQLNNGYAYVGGMKSNIFHKLTDALEENKSITNDVGVDALYPCDFDISSPYFQFHLLVWRNSDENRKNHFFDMVEITNPNNILVGVPSKLSFKSRKNRRDFIRWWNLYTKTFFDGIPPFDQFLPRIKQGKITGFFLEEKTALDFLPYQYTIDTLDRHNLQQGLLQVLPSWCWIVANCRKPVFHHTGGWFFSSGADAAKLRLFFPKSGS